MNRVLRGGLGLVLLAALAPPARLGGVGGGLQSSASIAGASQARQRPILMAWTGAASPLVEQLLAEADWFFHYHPWQYNNADSTWSFIRSTGAKTATLAIEDG